MEDRGQPTSKKDPGRPIEGRAAARVTREWMEASTSQKDQNIWSRAMMSVTFLQSYLTCATINI